MNNDNLANQVPEQINSSVNNTVAKYPKQSKKTKIFTWLVVIVLLAGNLVLGYLYYTQAKKVTDLQKQLESAKQVKTETVTETATHENTKTSYTATIGKFTLNLPDNLVIIKELDGAFEGGPATVLQVAQVLDDAKGVVGSDNPFSEVKITAIPTTSYDGLDGSNSFMSYILQQTGVPDYDESKPDKTIDGVTAKVYGFNGLGYTEWYVFENNGIYYGVEVAGADQEPSKSIIKEVIAGFSFN